MPLNICIQWNGGTTWQCVSECVLKTLACRGLRVGPSKGKTAQDVQNSKDFLKFPQVAVLKFLSAVGCRKAQRSANEHKKSVNTRLKGRKRLQKRAKERQPCQPPGLKQTGLAVFCASEKRPDQFNSQLFLWLMFWPCQATIPRSANLGARSRLCLAMSAWGLPRSLAENTLAMTARLLIQSVPA